MKMLLIVILLLGQGYLSGYDRQDEQKYLDRQEEAYRYIREQAPRFERPNPYRILIGEKPVLWKQGFARFAGKKNQLKNLVLELRFQKLLVKNAKIVYNASKKKQLCISKKSGGKYECCESLSQM